MLKDPSLTIFSCRLQKIVQTANVGVRQCSSASLHHVLAEDLQYSIWPCQLATDYRQHEEPRSLCGTSTPAQYGHVCLPPTSWDTCSSDLSWFGFAPRSVHYWLYWFKSDSFRSPRLRVADSKISQMIRKCFFGIWIVFPLSLIHSHQFTLPNFACVPDPYLALHLGQCRCDLWDWISQNSTSLTGLSIIKLDTQRKLSELWHVVARCGDVETKHDTLLHSVDAPWSSLSYQIEMCQKI